MEQTALKYGKRYSDSDSDLALFCGALAADGAVGIVAEWNIGAFMRSSSFGARRAAVHILVHLHKTLSRTFR